MLRIFCEEIPKGEMGWSLCYATCPGKKTPENVTQVLTNAALHLVSTISEHDVPKSLLVNSDQTGVTYSTVEKHQLHSPLMKLLIIPRQHKS